MLTTIELEKYVKKEISSKLTGIHWDKINFAERKLGSAEGTYIYRKEDKYHILFTEKGNVQKDETTVEEREVLWCVVDMFSFDIALKYAMKNWEKGKDFRRVLFKKELEIFSLFGEKFERKKKMEIDKILEKKPYKDIV